MPQLDWEWILELLLRVVKPLMIRGNMIAPPVVIWWLICWDQMMLRYVWPAEGFAFGPSAVEGTLGLFRLGVGLLVVHVFSWLAFALPLFWTHVQFWYRLPRLPREIAHGRPFMEVDADGSSKRRVCDDCGEYQGDRHRHSYRGHRRCALMYDHWCDWIVTGVYANNIKSFLVFVFALVCYQVITVAIIVYAMIDPRTRRWKQYLAGLFVVAPWILFVAKELQRVTKRLLVRNCLPDEGWYGVVVRVSIPGYHTKTISWTRGSGVPFPYDLGFRANVRQLMGPWFLMPAFWLPTPMMKHGPELSDEFLAYAR